jgi:shikimate kinase
LRENPSVNLFFIGYRGTGKSSVGRGVASILKRRFVDMDDELTGRLGRTIREHVARCGWPAFRAEESRLLRDLCRRDGWVVATGGGVVLDDDNVAAMRASGHVIWLEASPEVIARRLAADPRTHDLRPALSASPEPGAEIPQVLHARLPLYRRAAHWRIGTDERRTEQLCRELAERITRELRAFF